MKINKNIVLAGICSIAIIQSCKKDEETPTPTTTQEEVSEGKYTVPSQYTFTDVKGNNTVSFSGQKVRLEMLTELSAYMKGSNVAGTTLDVVLLKDMYANNGVFWYDFNSVGLNGSSKQLKDKTAYASAGGTPDAGVQQQFESLMDNISTLSGTTIGGLEDGSAGNGGVWKNDGVKGPYLMNGKGMEYMQFIEKGLMSAVFMSQITVNYLEQVKTDDNSAAVDESAGKYYTTMEHHWDEAFGYFTSAVDYPSSGVDRFWGKYAFSREGVLNSASKISLAFRKGRAAISNKDYVVRDAQITIIRNEIEKVAAATAIHYLNDAKKNITSATARNHFISEAYAFIDGLRYGYNSINGVSMSPTDIDQALSFIGNDFTQVTISDLQLAIDLVANKMGLENEKNIL